MRRVRHIATTRAGGRVAVGAYEREVAVWEIGEGGRAGALVSEFETVLDGVGDLAITPDGGLVLAGQYGAKGTGCYDAASGEALWVRKELKRLNTVEVVPDGSRAFCSCSEGSGRVVDVETGETVETLRGVRHVFVGGFEPVAFLAGTPQRILNWETGETIKQRNEDAFACAFAPGRICLSGPIGYTPGSEVGDTWARWCVDASSGEVVWRHSGFGEGGNSQLGYDERAGVFIGTAWDGSKGGPVYLERIDVGTGEVEGRFELPGSLPEVGLCRGGAEVLSWDGTVFDSGSGTVLRRLAFPDVGKGNA